MFYYFANLLAHMMTTQRPGGRLFKSAKYATTDFDMR